jgi:hypothetical protein
MFSRPRPGRARTIALLLAGGVVVGALAVAQASREGRTSPRAGRDPKAAACRLGPHILERVARGYRPARSEDVTIVPTAPNYVGSFDVTSHSGPWDYLQRVPLVLYGPSRLPPVGSVTREVTLADVYPTVEAWTDTPLEERRGESLAEAVGSGDGAPRLMVFVMWDGVGRNVLERWPDRWPNLARLEREGVSFANATVGSSPSITPATHATLGTGSFPNEHGLTGIQYRGPDGDIKVAFAQREPRDLDLTTFADQFDQALGNEPKVGLMGLRIWHIPMMGHGLGTPGGDKDQLALIGFDQKVSGNRNFYDTPGYLRGFEGLQGRIDELDQRDGVRDGRWLEHPIAEEHDNPAWARYQTDVLLEMWEREGYGADDVPDMFFVNYKMTDIVGHQYSMDSPEMGEVLGAQDEALGRIVEHLDRKVRDYVLVLSADHGHTPSPEVSGAWPISAPEVESDVNARFGVPEGESLLQQRSAVGVFLDPEMAQGLGVTADDVARFLDGYTIADNWSEEELPPAFLGRGDEFVFDAVFPSEDLPAVLACAGISSDT